MILFSKPFWLIFVFYFLIFLIITLPYNLAYGYSGLPDFGRALSAGMGGFLTGVIAPRLAMYLLGISGEWPRQSFKIISKVNKVLQGKPALSLGILGLLLLIGLIAGGLMGILGSFALKRGLSGFRFAITLLSMQIIVRQVFYRSPLLHGTHGVPVPLVFAWAPIGGTLFAIIIAGILVVIEYWYINTVIHSPLGRLLKAIREDEKSVRALGRSPNKVMMKTMGVTYALSAMAGVLLILNRGNVVGVDFKRVWWCFFPLAMLILGGKANNKGVIVGTLIFVFARRLLFTYNALLAPYLPFAPTYLNYLFVGVMLMILLVFRPQGLLPEERDLTFKREKIEEIHGRE